MTGSESTGGDEDWQPKEDPAPARPWGRLLEVGDLSAVVAQVTPFSVVEANVLRDAIVRTALEKFRVGSGKKRRVHVNIPNVQPFDVVVSLPAARRGATLRSVHRVLPKGTTFKLIPVAPTRIRPSSARTIRRSDALTGQARSLEVEMKLEGKLVKVNLEPATSLASRLSARSAGYRSHSD